MIVLYRHRDTNTNTNMMQNKQFSFEFFDQRIIRTFSAVEMHQVINRCKTYLRLTNLCLRRFQHDEYFL